MLVAAAVGVAAVLASCTGTSGSEVVIRSKAEATGSKKSAATTTTAPPDCAAMLSPAAKASQLLMVMVPSPDKAAAAVQGGLVGGFGVNGNQSKSVADQVAAAVKNAPLPASVAADEEGGNVQRLSAALGSFPSAADLAKGSPADAAAKYAQRAAAMKGLGFTMDFAPVADVGSGSGLGTRSFGSDPETVSSFVDAIVPAIKQSGVLPVVKHWPGIGGGKTDPHQGLTKLAAVETLRTKDLVPFDRAIAAGAPAIMVTHADVPNLTVAGAPASISRPAITDELRGREKFNGLVITDSLGMGGALKLGTQDEVAEKAVTAGADIALLSSTDVAQAAHDRLADAISTGRIPADQALASVRRVLAAKGVTGPCIDAVARFSSLETPASTTTVAGSANGGSNGGSTTTVVTGINDSGTGSTTTSATRSGVPDLDAALVEGALVDAARGDDSDDDRQGRQDDDHRTVSAFDPTTAGEHLSRVWADEIVPALAEYIRVPALSPAFDAGWASAGHIDRAAEMVRSWCSARDIDGLTVTRHDLAGRTPVIVMEVPPTPGFSAAGTVLLYGHLDKQPEMSGWSDGRGPWEPVLDGTRLYGRGGADDGYAAFAVCAALEALAREAGPTAAASPSSRPPRRSGSPDLPAHIEALAGRIGTPDLVVCLDSGVGDYDRLWVTTSLRGFVGLTVRVRILTEGVHSGEAGGVVPSSFRILRSLLSRIEDPDTGEVLLPELVVEVPEERRRQAETLTGGLTPADHFPLVEGARPQFDDPLDQQLARTWRSSVAVVGLGGAPTPDRAGNVLRPFTDAALSIRLPPTCDPVLAKSAVIAALTTDPPHQAEITVSGVETAAGWNAPATAGWLADAVEVASDRWFGRPVRHMGEGGSIPFMAMLGERSPTPSS